MRKDLNLFLEPNTNRSLHLEINKMQGEHIISGRLYNGRKYFPIIRGIPRFVDKSFYRDTTLRTPLKQTSHSFGKKWNEPRYRKLGYKKKDVAALGEQFMAVLGAGTLSELKGILKKSGSVLNAGCGVAWSEYLFNYNPDVRRHCIDISLSVETAYERTKGFPNVIVSQASIFALPYPDAYFDIIYSIGVIHHTPYPEKAFRALAKKLAPGGLMGVYIYNKKPFLREMADREIRKITSKMSYDKCMSFSKCMTNMGRALSKIKKPITIDDDMDILGIKKGSYGLQRLVYDYFIKCWYDLGQDRGYADLVNQDWYHPHYASHHTKEEITGWFKKCGMMGIRVIQPKGWEHSGYFISGRKK